MQFESVAESLTLDEYTRERLQPHPRDFLYLHLKDLRQAVETIRTDASLKILDYGCGSSPYISLFPNAEYRRADFLDTGNLDYRLGNDSRVPEVDAQFDLVLSTQVLEHVSEPQVFLAECFRLLRPGGKLFLTTHGLYEDHGCPYDFQRWTADGLDLALAKAGFVDIKITKLTSGPRAILFFMGTHLEGFRGKKGTVARFLFRHYRKAFVRFRKLIHETADAQFPQHMLVPREEPGHIIYICLAAQAQRPA